MEIILILNILLTMYIAFFKKYFEKKGENQATKEDIQEITELIKSVEIKFENLKIKFEKIHPYRIEFIKELYGKLFQFKNDLFYNIEMITEDPQKKEEYVEICFQLLTNIQNFYYHNCILSEESIDRLMYEYFYKNNELIKKADKYQRMENNMHNKIYQILQGKNFEELFNDLNKLQSDIPELEKQLKTEFKKLLF